MWPTRTWLPNQYPVIVLDKPRLSIAQPHLLVVAVIIPTIVSACAATACTVAVVCAAAEEAA